MKYSILATAVLIGFPLAALAQAGPTQDRTGFPTA